MSMVMDELPSETMCSQSWANFNFAKLEALRLNEGVKAGYEELNCTGKATCMPY